MIDAFYLIIADGYKHDNGQYRNGYVLELEKYIIKVFPTTDLREKPHIESKIKTWRKQWGSIYTALATSGIARNASQKMLTIDDEDVWTQICKVRHFTILFINICDVMNTFNSLLLVFFRL